MQFIRHGLVDTQLNRVGENVIAISACCGVD
jgi:hypothetical protein